MRLKGNYYNFFLMIMVYVIINDSLKVFIFASFYKVITFKKIN